MRGFTRALGLRCSHCHVGEEGAPLATYDFAADEKPLKARAEAHPGSWNAFDSLGEALERAGQGGAAAAAYRRSLELNPENERARQRLEALEDG